jgi:hypothetical protein
MPDDDGKTHRRRKGRKGLPVDVFRQDRSENRLPWLMRAGHVSLPFRHLQRCRRRSTHTGCFSTLASTGILRRRLPVAAKIALATAGTMAEVPHSPMPPGGSELWTMWTSMAGASFMRSIWYVSKLVCSTRPSFNFDYQVGGARGPGSPSR